MAPAVVSGQGAGKGSFIVMEHLNFGGSYSQADLGQALAEMHKAEPAVSFLCSPCQQHCNQDLSASHANGTANLTYLASLAKSTANVTFFASLPITMQT